MTETIQHAKKIGGSLMVRIPKEIVDAEHILPGEAVRLNVEKVRKDWFGITPGVRPFDKKLDRFDFDDE